MMGSTSRLAAFPATGGPLQGPQSRGPIEAAVALVPGPDWPAYLRQLGSGEYRWLHVMVALPGLPGPAETALLRRAGTRCRRLVVTFADVPPAPALARWAVADGGPTFRLEPDVRRAVRDAEQALRPGDVLAVLWPAERGEADITRLLDEAAEPPPGPVPPGMQN